MYSNNNIKLKYIIYTIGHFQFHDTSYLYLSNLYNNRRTTWRVYYQFPTG